MGERRPLRLIDDPTIAAPPAGVRIRTRIQLTEQEAAGLAAVGKFLGSVYRAELAARVRLGHLDRKSQAVWRAKRKHAISKVSSSRWAGAVTRAVEDQYQLGLRGLGAHVVNLRQAIEALEQRCALRPGERGRGRLRGYRSAGERFAKTRRLAVLRSRLVAAEAALTAGRPSITLGGNRLWRNRSHLDDAKSAEGHWRARWDAARIFLTADGETGKIGGNETIRVDDAGRLRIKVPVALSAEWGSHIDVAAQVGFAHRGAEWRERLAVRRATRYDITYDPIRDRWYLHASWRQETHAPPPSLEQLRTGPVLGVDLNANHVAICVLDGSGNPVGGPASITMETAGLPASRRDGRVRAAITALLDVAARSQCTALVIENLDFDDARAVGRETMGRGQRGKRFRRTVAGIPTASFRARLTSMATRRGVSVVGVHPAYTSRWGAQHWQKPLQQQTSEPVTRHHAAAAAIGRRGLGMRIGRRPAGPRNGQRTVASTPPARLDRPRATMGGVAVPAHRHPPDG